jgi:hypothetical protein
MGVTRTGPTAPSSSSVNHGNSLAGPFLFADPIVVFDDAENILDKYIVVNTVYEP